MKRVLDILIALIALATLIGPFAIVASVLKMTGIHKVWFLQERVGQHGRHFKESGEQSGQEPFAHIVGGYARSQAEWYLPECISSRKPWCVPRSR